MNLKFDRKKAEENMKLLVDASNGLPIGTGEDLAPAMAAIGGLEVTIHMLSIYERKNGDSCGDLINVARSTKDNLMQRLETFFNIHNFSL